MGVLPHQSEGNMKTEFRFCEVRREGAYWLARPLPTVTWRLSAQAVSALYPVRSAH